MCSHDLVKKKKKKRGGGGGGGKLAGGLYGYVVDGACDQLLAYPFG